MRCGVHDGVAAIFQRVGKKQKFVTEIHPLALILDRDVDVDVAPILPEPRPSVYVLVGKSRRPKRRWLRAPWMFGQITNTDSFATSFRDSVIVFN